MRSANWFRAVTLPSNVAWLQTKSAEQWPGLFAQVATDRQQLIERLYLNHDYTSARRQTGHFEVAPHRHVARTEARYGCRWQRRPSYPLPLVFSLGFEPVMTK